MGRAKTTEDLEIRGAKISDVYVERGVEVEVSESTVQIPPLTATLAVGIVPGVEGYVILTSDNCEAVEAKPDGS